METYLILRRAAWSDADEAEESRTRAAAEAERLSELVEWRRTYSGLQGSRVIGELMRRF